MPANPTARRPLFIGIDQTGAVIPGKPHLPRPLPCAWFDEVTARLGLLDQGLERFDPQLLRNQIGAPAKADRDLILLLDCVLGLPLPLGRLGFERALSELQALERLNPLAPYGRKPAEEFFAKILQHYSESLPTRVCEKLAIANSVFKTRPYQKNIQTGTYRLWRQLSTHRKELKIWPFDSPKGPRGPRNPMQRPSLFLIEGYPSLLWRKIFGFKTRTPQKLAARLSDLGVRIDPAQSRRLADDPNLADAAVLAVGAWLLDRQGTLGRRPKVALPHCATTPFEEGWIAGL